MALENDAYEILRAYIEEVKAQQDSGREIPQADIRLVAQILRELRGAPAEPAAKGGKSFLDIEDELRKKLEDEWEPSG